MSVDVKYRTKATATGGRDGHSATEDGAVDVKLVTPKELGGAGGDGVNPEQLFATGYAACFMGALKFVASQDKVELSSESSVSAEVGIGPRADGGGFGLEVDLIITLPGIEADIADDLIARAHVVCPYSNATQNNIRVGLSRG
ncbi:organic hydroperoxide resistance protein [Seohaeicola saemankumensis]|uniref:organic hydroperoxide resistance protein n=1 Tax=Seohaeicola saemankumensis TaxID=481181 RepID=UPI001E5A507D|nr:organic hydroperoxide resistance protein [Seohaeicola saemankumensis]MCD1624790.1 organic hydroperoxide resistance protein [Seohaeicola saemankumensis]